MSGGVPKPIRGRRRGDTHVLFIIVRIIPTVECSGREWDVGDGASR